MVHAAIFVLLLSMAEVRVGPPTPTAGLALVAVALKPDTGRPPPPALPSRSGDQQRTPTPPSREFEADSDASGSAAGCATLEVVGKAVVADPAAFEAVVNAPPESRSIAEAVVIWNAGWSDTARGPTAPLGPARAAVERSLMTLPAECLTEMVAGPRLLPVPVADGRTMFVVIGSGAWSWGQLLSDPATPIAPAQEPTKAIWGWDWYSLFGER